MVVETNLLKQRQNQSQDSVKEAVSSEKSEDKTKDKENKKDQKKLVIKSLFLSVLTVVCSFFAWYMLRKIFWVLLSNKTEFNNFFNQNFLIALILTFLAFFLMIALVAICSFLIKPKSLNIINLALAVAVYLIFFKPQIYTLTVLIILFLILVYYHWRINRESQLTLYFSVMRNIRYGLGWVITLVLILVALSYFQAITKDERTITGFNQVLVSYTTEAINGIFKTKFNEYRPDMTLDEFLMMFASGNAAAGLSNGSLNQSANPLTSILGNIIPANQKGMLLQTLANKSIDKIVQNETSRIQDEMMKQVREDFLKGLGIEASGNDNMNLVINKFIQKKFDDYLAPYRNFIPIFLVFILYFILQIFSFVYSAFIKLIAWIIFSILRLVGFVKIKEVEVKAQRAML